VPVSYSRYSTAGAADRCETEWVFTRPSHVSDSDVIDVLRAGWGFDVSTAEYLPVGFGSHHWRAETSERMLFVTVDDLSARRQSADEPLRQVRHRLVAALSTAQALARAGLDFVVAPEPTVAGDVVYELTPSHVIAVYRNVDGQMRSYGNYDTHDERVEVLDRLIALHAAPHECRAAALMDNYAIANHDGLEEALRNLAVPWKTGPFADRTRHLLGQQTDRVIAVLDRYDHLVRRIQARPDQRVVTHGEPHPANTIVTDHGVVLIDWDTTLIAPPERDLWDLIGQDDAITDLYAQRTGTAIDHDAVELYRLMWDLNEIAIYVDQFRHAHVLSEDTETAFVNLLYYLDSSRF
jgi:aminoglycoside phosphotransferase (APT) family kinase protein